MRQLSAIASVGILVLPLAGCNSNTEESATTAAPQVVATTPTAKPFTKPAMVAQKPTVVTSPGLIQPTNANQRAKQVQTGRQDPFAGLFIQTRPSVAASGSPTGTSQPGSPTVVATAPSSRGTSTQSAASGTSNGETNRDNQVAAATGTSSSNPNSSGSSGDGGIPSSPEDDFPVSPDEGAFPPPLPSTPEPELARQIGVSGVIQIGEQLQAIVQVPNEGTSRYVRVGQRLSNGEILVKRIEMTPGVEPIVVLEQYGVEVAKAIGEQPAGEANGAESTPSPDEVNPVPTPPPTPQPTPSPAASPVPTPLPTNVQPTLPPGVNPVPVPPPLPNGAPDEGG